MNLDEKANDFVRKWTDNIKRRRTYERYDLEFMYRVGYQQAIDDVAEEFKWMMKKALVDE